MDTIEIIMWILALMCAAVLACWLAYQSTVIQEIKSWLGMSEQQTLPKWKWWFKPLGWMISEFKFLINCPYCTSFWLGLLTNIFLFKITIPLSILYACLCIVFVDLYRKISL